MLDEVRAGRRAVAGDDVDRRRREADLARELGEPQRGERRRGVRLQHDRAAGRERRRELPRRHHQRVVPRHDLRRRRRPAPSASRRGASRRSGSSGRRSTRSRTRRSGSSRPPRLSSAFTDEIALPTLRDSSSASSLRFATIASASACSRRERSVGGVFAPVAAERGARGLDRAVDVGLAADRGAGERLAGRRLDQLAGLRRPRRTRR